MAADQVARKRRIKHLKLDQIGASESVHFGNEWVTITIRIPRKHLTQRLLGQNWRHIKRLGIPIPRNFNGA
jgi:hypothetical protein